MNTDTQTTNSALVWGQIWRTTIPGNRENARQVESLQTDGKMIFALRAPPGPPIAQSRTAIEISEWWQWVEAHKAETIDLHDMINPPGQEPRHA